MINVLVPITNYNKKYREILLQLSGDEDINLLVGISNKIRNEVDYLDSSLVHIYDDSFDKEAVLNSLFTKVEEGSILIMRQPITLNEFNSMVTNGENIVTCRKHRNVFTGFMFKIWQKILKTFLGVSLYSGDTSVVYFSEVLLPILIENGNLSFASRVDRWIGVDKTTENVKCEPEKYEPDKKSITKYCIFADVSLLFACLVTTLVCVLANVGIVLGLLLFCVDAICLAIILISVVLIIFNCSVGRKNVEMAIEIGNIYEDEEE